MVLDFVLEAAKRRDQPGRGLPAIGAAQTKAAYPPDRHFARVEYGSGWYHSAAVEEAGTIQSHRDHC